MIEIKTDKKPHIPMETGVILGLRDYYQDHHSNFMYIYGIRYLKLTSEQYLVIII